MRLRSGPRGDFFGCSRFPKCRGTRRLHSFSLEDQRIVWKTTLHEVNGEIVSAETAVVMPVDFHDPDEPAPSTRAQRLIPCTEPGMPQPPTRSSVGASVGTASAVQLGDDSATSRT